MDHYKKLSKEYLEAFNLSLWCRLGWHTWGPWINWGETESYYDVRQCLKCGRSNLRMK